SGALLDTELVTAGPRRSLEANVSSVTTPGKKAPTRAKTSAAPSVKPVRSSAAGEASTKRTVAVGMLIAAPARASSERKPSLALTSALPKHAALRQASVVARLMGDSSFPV